MNIKNIINIAFVAVLWLPFLAMSLGIPITKNTTEKRKPVQRPEINSIAHIVSFPVNYERYFNDNFGFRPVFIALNTAIQTRIFKTSPLTTVVVGEKDWLYYNNNADGIGLSDYLGRSKLSESELQIIQKKVAKERDQLKNKGIRLIVAVAPDKQSVYPEYLPKKYKKIGENRLDQIMGTGSSPTADTVFDLRPVLSEAKKYGETYYRTDSHWNKYGASIAFRTITKGLFKSENILTKTNMESEKIKGGDLATMMSAGDKYSDSEIKDKSFACGDLINKDIKILVFHDSFGDYLAPYFYRCIPQSTFVASTIVDPKIVDEIKPKIVIWEMSERYLGNRLISE